jgi:intein/homing endonuclease
MAEQKLTIYQKLQKVLATGSVQSLSSASNTYNIHQQRQNNDVVDIARSPQERDMKILQAKQQKLMARQWYRAQQDINNQSLAGLNDVRLMYRDVDLMDCMPEIGSALDVISEETCFVGESGSLINVSSGSERVKGILQDLFVNRLSINTTLPMLTRSMIKYGNAFWLLHTDTQLGVLGWKELPVYEIERYENGMDCPYTNGYSVSSHNIDEHKDETRFIWVGQQHATEYRNWQIAHFRLLYDSSMLPYGCLVGDTRVETENGFKEIADIEIGDKIWTFNVETHERELSNVTMTKDKGVKETFLLETKHYYLEGTSDHKVLTFDNGELKYKEIGQLLPGDLIVASNSEKTEYKYITIDKSDLKSYEKGQKSIHWWTDYIDNIPYYVNDDFAKLFGFLIGDGWVSHGYHVMFALGEHKSLNDTYCKLLHRFSGKEVRYTKNSNKKRKLEYHTAYVGSKMLYTILKRMGFNGNACTKRIPNWVFNSDTEIREAFLDGLIDADGSLKIQSNKLFYTIELTNEQLIKDIKTLAMSLGYRVGKICKRNRIGRESFTITEKPIIAQHESFYINFCQEPNIVDEVNDKIRWKQKGLILEKVKKITPTGEKRTYDITVENDNSNFFANGIVTHNCSFLHKARRHFRMLSMMEDMMFIYRLDRSIERRVFKINVGAIDEADVPAYVQQIADNFKRTPIIDPMTGQVDLRKNIMNQTNDFFIPTRTEGEASPIETLPAGQNLTAMDDIKYVQNKIFTALRVPKSFLNFEETTGDGKNLSLLDVRFMRTVNRIQQALLLELNKIATIHLLMLGFTDDLTNFTLSMVTPSSQAEMLELENLAKKVTTAKDIVSDPGGGMPIASMSWAWKHIFKWSDKEIQQNLEEMRLETALAAELQQTMQIINRTHIFDPVDNIYGEIGAEYSQSGGQGQGDDGGIGGPSGGGGGLPMGGDMDFGDEMGPPEMGAEGDMDMGTAAAEDAAMGDGGEPPMEGGASPNLAEMVTTSLKKNVISEINKRKNNLQEKHKAIQHNILEHYMKTISREKDDDKAMQQPIYNKVFFMNEEMNDIIKKMTKTTNKNLND